MRIAFYAPLKPPDHPVPSGDRRVAGLLLDALRLAGHRPFVASRLRIYDGHGDPARQARLAAIGAGDRPAPAPALAPRSRRRARSVVHLSPVLQGAGLARPGDQRGARHPICRRRGVERAEAGRRARGISGSARSNRRCAGPTRCSGSILPIAIASCRCCAIPGAGSPFRRSSTHGHTPPRRGRAALVAAPPDHGGDDAARRQARFLSPARRRAGEAVRSRLVARYRRRRRGARRGCGGAGPARPPDPLARRARRGGSRRRSRRCRPVRLAGDKRGVRHGAARSAGERAAGRGRGERRRVRHRRRSARPGCWFRPAIRSRSPPRCAF